MALVTSSRGMPNSAIRRRGKASTSSAHRLSSCHGLRSISLRAPPVGSRTSTRARWRGTAVGVGPAEGDRVELQVPGHPDRLDVRNRPVAGDVTPRADRPVRLRRGRDLSYPSMRHKSSPTRSSRIVVAVEPSNATLFGLPARGEVPDDARQGQVPVHVALVAHAEEGDRLLQEREQSAEPVPEGAGRLEVSGELA